MSMRSMSSRAIRRRQSVSTLSYPHTSANADTLSAVRAATARSAGRCSISGKKFATRRQALECALAMKP